MRNQKPTLSIVPSIPAILEMDELKTNDTIPGLTTQQAQKQLAVYGHNQVEEKRTNPWLA